MNKRHLFPVFWILVIFLVNGCAILPRINERTLVRIYAKQSQYPKKNPVIFIPGAAGSVLKDSETGRTVWGKLGRGFMKVLALPIGAVTLFADRDNIEPTQILRNVSLIPGLVEVEIYGQVPRIAIQAGGYVMEENAFTLPYDWRRELVEAAEQLGSLIERIKRESGQPDIKINLVCHSAGGLVARYYVKYGTIDVLAQESLPQPTYAGAANINKVIMLGTPNSGSLKAFQRIHEGLWIPTFGIVTPEVAFTMPSLYELLPYEREDIFVNDKGVILDVNLYEPANWEKYGWSVFNPRRQAKLRRKFLRHYGVKKGQILYEEQVAKQRQFLTIVLKRAKRFHQALWQGDPDEEKRHVTYVLLGSGCQPTLRRALLEQGATGWRTRFKVSNRKLMDILYDFGDRSVTKESLLGIRPTQPGQTQLKMSRLPAAAEIFFCENHYDLTKSPAYMDNVLHLLLE